MSVADDVQQVGKLLILLGVITAVVIVAFSAFAGTMTDQSSPEDRRTSPDPETGTFVSFADTSIRSGGVTQFYRANDSTGFAIELSGADDSFVESQQSVTIASDETWTVCTWASVDSGAASDNMTALSANGRVLIEHNGTQGNWSAWYYDDGSRNSWRVNVSAPNQPGNYSHVCAWHNTTHLSIYRNNTQGDLVNTSSGSNIEPANVNATNWNGRLEEVRTFDEALNNSQRQALVDAPVHPLANATRTARLMFDEGSGSTTAMFFTSTRADLSNHTWVGGHPGHILTEGTDYEVRVNNGAIQALADGRIDGAPVVWTFFEFDPWDGPFAGTFKAVENLGASALVLAALAVLILAGRSALDGW